MKLIRRASSYIGVKRRKVDDCFTVFTGKRPTRLNDWN